jgi:uncharacterized membrane protein YhaH (DUF805 family)
MPQAGWYEDPEDGARLRYWDGSRWTEDRQAREAAPPPPPAAPPIAPPPPGSASAFPSASAPLHAPGFATYEPAPARDIGDAIDFCLRNYATFQGRASRSEYWYFFLFYFLVSTLTGMVSTDVQSVANLALFIPYLAVGTRRLHDIGRSGASLLWWLLPVIGWVPILIWTTRAGDPGPNQYG